MSRFLTTAVVLVLLPWSAALAEGPTRDEMIDSAAAYAEHEWVCAKENTLVAPSCSTTWTSDYEIGEHVVGLPYDWGGYKTIERFDEDIAAGYGAGSHSWHGILNCTTGVDCSGFVSQVWQCGRYTTSSVHQVSHPIDGDEILPGDAYNKAGSHIVLWAEESRSGQPVFYEATTGSVNRVHLDENATWSSLEGYVAIRSDLLEPPDELLIGTPQEPIEIESFPFEDDNDTRGAPSDVWDSYGCAPQREEGPEVVYRFTTLEPGELRIVVTDEVGIDVDIHLLAEADSDSCVERDDTEIVVDPLEPGTWYISADTWTNDEGADLSGPYHLLVEFFPDSPPDADAGHITPDIVDGEDTSDPDVAWSDEDVEGERDSSDEPGTDAWSNGQDAAGSDADGAMPIRSVKSKDDGCTPGDNGASPAAMLMLLALLLVPSCRRRRRRTQ